MSARPGVDSRSRRRCIKCGREVGTDESMCEVCNRAGMVPPSASQYHGTMLAAIVAGVAALALWASLSMQGVGPYQATVDSVLPAPPGAVDVTFDVTNQGTARGYAKCRVQALGAGGSVLRMVPISAGPLEGGATGSFTERVPGLSAMPDSVTVDCR